MKNLREKPYCHLFKCSTGCYLYDVNTDTILKITNESYEILANEKTDKSYNKELHFLDKSGYLKTNRVEISEHPATCLLERYYEKSLHSLVLQVTQQCNLRCEYCVYSGHYTGRVHSEKNMSWKVAKKAIDFLLNHAGESEKLEIGFYGGEPLINFILIEQCVKYLNDVATEKKITYYLTTNATLLSEQIIDFFYNNNFKVTISLDGPMDVHDKYRVYYNTGLGTFTNILNKLNSIRLLYPDYYNKNIDFNVVIKKNESFYKICDFFDKHPYFKNSVVHFSFLNDIGYDSSISATEEFIIEYKYKYFLALAACIDIVEKRDVSKLGYDILRNIDEMRGGKHNSGRVKVPQKWHHGGACVPGEKAIFVNLFGEIYPCERVTESSPITVIGNINDGIDIERVKKVINIEKYTSDECRNCWAYEYCDTCIRYAEKSEESLRNNILNHCGEMRKQVENYFKDYCVLKELGYDFEWKSMKEKHIWRSENGNL